MSSSPTSSSSNEAAAVYDAMLDVPCRVEVVVGTGSIAVRDCLSLKPQSIVKLAEPAGSDLILVVGGIRVAAGEPLVEEEGVSLRVTEILQPQGADDER